MPDTENDYYSQAVRYPSAHTNTRNVIFERGLVSVVYIWTHIFYLSWFISHISVVLFSNKSHLQFNPLPGNEILNGSKLKQNADDILKCIEIENKCHLG